MYPEVKSPKNLTKEWLDQAFAPLRDHLNANYPEKADKIMSFMHFMGNEEGKFYYKNSLTKSYVVMNQNGEPDAWDEAALECDGFYFGDPDEATGKPEAFVDTSFVHPNVEKWIKRQLTRKEEIKYGKDLRPFLQHMWGPVINYDFSALNVGYPFTAGGSKYCLYLFSPTSRGIIAFRLVGDEIAEQTCSCQEYQDFMMGGNPFVIRGWRLMTLIREMMETESSLALTRDLLMQMLDFNVR